MGREGSKKRERCKDSKREERRFICTFFIYIKAKKIVKKTSFFGGFSFCVSFRLFFWCFFVGLLVFFFFLFVFLFLFLKKGCVWGVDENFLFLFCFLVFCF